MEYSNKVLRSIIFSLSLLLLVNACGSGDGTDTTEPEEGSVTLFWDKNSDVVSGYRVFAGVTIDSAVDQVADLGLSTPGFNYNAPSVSFNPDTEIWLSNGSQVCFRLKAYNAIGESGYSSGVCGTVPG